MSRRATMLLLAAILIAVGHDRVLAMTQSQIEERLACQCGCGLTVAACDHHDCSFAVPVRREIAEALAAGRSGEEIIAGYVEEYGEKVLSSPLPVGFNLLAWIGPYLALGAAALLVVLRLRRVSRKTENASTAKPATALSDAERERLDRELDEV